jgi:hypothetical protein
MIGLIIGFVVLLSALPIIFMLAKIKDIKHCKCCFQEDQEVQEVQEKNIEEDPFQIPDLYLNY